MAIFKNGIALEIARGVKAFVSFEVGVTRGAAPGTEADVPRELKQTRERIEEQRQELESKDREIERLRSPSIELGGAKAQSGRINPENMIWIFGSGRTGSTWLVSMMKELRGQVVWHEPLIGALFGNLYYVRAGQGHRNNRHFILGSHRESWLESIRSFVLQGASDRFSKIGEKGYLVIKEPNGSIGAPLLAEALPESRLVFLVRDPRDTVASSLDAFKKGSWRREYEQKNRKSQGGETATEVKPEVSARRRAETYSRDIGNSREAYEAHGGPKALVRYEDLLADTLGTMKRLYSDLGIEVSEKELQTAVEKHSWENIPEEKKGEGKFYRKGSSGGWREDLTEEQARIVEETTAPLLEEFYPEREKR